MTTVKGLHEQSMMYTSYLCICAFDELKFNFDLNTGGLVLPEGADVTYGSGEEGEEYDMERADPGDIVPGILDPVPAARTKYSSLKKGASLWVKMNGEKLKATHWGHGVVLLDRDRLRITDW